MKDTLCHEVRVQSLEVRCGEVLLKLFPKVKEGVETVRDQDVLQREGIKYEDVNMWPISSCHFIATIYLLKPVEALISLIVLRNYLWYVHGCMSSDSCRTTFTDTLKATSNAVLTQHIPL